MPCVAWGRGRPRMGVAPGTDATSIKVVPTYDTKSAPPVGKRPQGFATAGIRDRREQTVAPARAEGHACGTEGGWADRWLPPSAASAAPSPQGKAIGVVPGGGWAAEERSAPPVGELSRQRLRGLCRRLPPPSAAGAASLLHFVPLVASLVSPGEGDWCGGCRRLGGPFLKGRKSDVRV